MIQQTPTRQADETVCFRCGATVKRDAGACPNCGSAIAAGPQHAAARSFEERSASTMTWSTGDQDVVGVGRYVLNFLLAGFVGLVLTYFLRKQGWTATWISAAILIFLVVVAALYAS